MKSFRPKANWLRWRGLPLLVLVVAAALTLAYWQRTCAEERQGQLQAFHGYSRLTVQRVQQRVLAQQHLLQGAQGFLAALPQADGPAFKRYVQALPLDKDFAGLQGLALVRPREHGKGQSSATLVQIEPSGPGNFSALGQDLMAQPQAWAALEQARSSGQMAMSAQLDLGRLGLAAQRGYLLAMPFYGDGEPPATPDERRARLQAWVVAPVSLPALMDSMSSVLPRGLALALYDGQQVQADQLLYRSNPLHEALAIATAQESVLMGGHHWTIAMQASESFARKRVAEDAPLVLVAGMAVAAMLALLVWLIGTARERAQAMAEQMTRALRESEQRWAFALEGSGDGVWDWLIGSERVVGSARWKAIMHFPPDHPDPSMEVLLSLIHPDDRPLVQAALRRCLDGSIPNMDSEFRVSDGTGGWNWVHARGTVIERDAQQRPLRLIGTLSDINGRRLSEERVRFMALHDPLTELANRAHFDERLRFALANARRYDESLGLILLDLDRFKPINDRYGHGMGDQLLQTVAKRIRASVRETDTVGRIGGDEFVVLLTGPVTRETAQLVADKIFNQVALPMELGGVRLEITCSIGLAIYPEDGLDEKALAHCADAAMYGNKRAGQNLSHDKHWPADAPPRP